MDYMISELITISTETKYQDFTSCWYNLTSEGFTEVSRVAGSVATYLETNNPNEAKKFRRASSFWAMKADERQQEQNQLEPNAAKFHDVYGRPLIKINGNLVPIEPSS